MGSGPASPSGWRPLSEPRRAAPASFTPSGFSRLARVQALAVASDTLIATSLAGSLFFSIPTGEARGRVALYLLLTIAPFAIVGPLMGPALDRMQGGRRLLIILTGVAKVGVCVAMARNVDSLLLFPLAFGALVLGKAYTIARSAIVPTVVDDDADLVQANSKLSLLTGVTSLAAAAPGALVLRVFDAPWVLVLAAVAGAAQAVLALQLPSTQVAAEPPAEAEQEELRGAGVVLAGEAMGLLRGVVGFLTFLLAFALRGGGEDTPVPTGLALGRKLRDIGGFELPPVIGATGAPAWHFGVVLAVSLVGALVGAALAPRFRAMASEERILQGGLATTAVAGVFAAAAGGLVGAAIVAVGVGFSSSAGKLAFDAIVQRDAPDANRGRSFAMFEARFQLIWVIGAFVPVVVPLPARVGFLVVAVAAGFALFTYLGGVRGAALPRRRPGPDPFDDAGGEPPPPEPVPPTQELAPGPPAAETALLGPSPKWRDDE